MSTDLEQKLAVAMAKIAELDEKLSSAKKASAPLTTIDPRQLEADPFGTMKRAGIDVDHVTKHAIVHAMGDQAPAHLKEYVRMGQQYSNAAMNLDAKIETLGRRIDEVVGGSRRESFQKLAADQSKYPHLATAFAADPTLFDGEVGQADDVVDVATKLETRLAKLAPALGAKSASASAASADNSVKTDSAQESQAKPAPTADALQGDPPIPQRVPTGALDANGKKALRDEIVRQYSPKE